MTATNPEHNWVRERKVAKYADWDKCSRCGIKKHTAWMPGWPSAREYYDKSGAKIQTALYEVPACEVSK